MVRNVGNSARSLGGSIRARLLGAGIRTKALGLVAVPMVFMLLFSAVVVSRSFGDTKRAERIGQLAGVSTELATFVNALQLERGATLGYLRTPGAGASQPMLAQRKNADAALIRLRGTLGNANSSDVSPAVDRALAAVTAANARIPDLRLAVDKSTLSAGEIQRSYGAVISDDLALPDLLADAVSDSDLARKLRAFGAISRLLEATAQERDAIVVGSAAGRFTADQYVSLAGSISTQGTLTAVVSSLATSEQKRQLTAVVGRPAAASFLSYRQMAVSSGSTRPLVVPTAAYSVAAGQRLSDLRKIQVSYSTSVTALADSVRSAARVRSLLIAGLVVLGLAFPLVHALVLSRRIVRPLRKLIEAAEQIRLELPRMVERMRKPGQDPDITLEPIEVFGQDEVGRLAQAFNTVNEVTVQVAVEQAALRGSIAEMFVNVARRNQALLGRQLAFLDQLEAGEEDPDALRNLFHLDHLAAQMRRNAESLLVLAGIDATRRLRAPMPLSDVLRTAMGEIEGFQRVQLNLDIDPEVTGLRALSVAHLLAELLDNATHFSDPQTKVQVTAYFDGESVVVDVYDEGLGLTPEELAEANHRLASVSATEIAVAQRLGFYVVGRIAQRLEIRVELKSQASGGTVAVVTLPAALFVGGSLPAGSTPREKPAVAALDAAVMLPTEEAAEVQLTTLLPVTDSRRRRHRTQQAQSLERERAAPVPVVETSHEMPFAVQDILPGRRLRRLTVLPGVSNTPAAAAPPAAGPLPVPILPIPAPRDAFPRAGEMPAGGEPAASLPASAPEIESPPAAVLPQLQPAHSPMRSNEAARSALAELSQLTASPYTPSFDGGGSSPSPSAPRLTQRTPKPADVPEPATAPLEAAAPRSAEQVRGQLSGFRAGVERGRHAQHDAEPDQKNGEQS